MNEDETELDLAYIVLYGKFIKWLEGYAEGQHDEAARNVYRVFANTETGEGLFEAYAAGMKQGIAENTTPTAAKKAKNEDENGEKLEAFFEELKAKTPA